VFRALVLGIVQGLTEFLPISSSAHLSIVPRLLGWRTPELAFDVLLHFGTLAAVVAYFARDLWAFLLCLVAPGRLAPAQARSRRRLLGLLVLASAPAALVGYLLENWADAQTTRPLRAAVWLVVTTAIMIGAELYDRRRTAAAVPLAYPAAGEVRRGPASRVEGVVATRAERHGRGASAGGAGGAEEEMEELPVAQAAGIGVAQALALVPGTSRSGVTISAGLFEGVSREAAARFSFLLSIPAILGAGILKLGDLSGSAESLPELLVGFLAAAVSGFLAVSFLIRMLRTRTLWPFIWYRLAAGGLFVLLLATVRR
jgi:undecaprenyl-diphosphatase